MKEQRTLIHRVYAFQQICFLFLMVAMVVLPQTSCKVGYSFTGASISPDVKTVAIPFMINSASLVVPTLSRTLTNALRDYFTTQTSLQAVDRNGDLELTGNITGYGVTPVAIQGNETAAMNRLTITVSIKFVNKKNPKQNYESSFSRYQDYPVADLTTVQDRLIAVITDQLVQDIFNKSVVNW
ncbi:MAG: LptE family protein [Bacteroidetes bacterium]|nr:LptE family protein [Bacteroidota bacterium]